MMLQTRVVMHTANPQDTNHVTYTTDTCRIHTLLNSNDEDEDEETEFIELTGTATDYRTNMSTYRHWRIAAARVYSIRQCKNAMKSIIFKVLFVYCLTQCSTDLNITTD